MNLKIVLVIAAMLLGGLKGAGQVREWGGPVSVGRPGEFQPVVLLYARPDFRGPALAFYPGDDVDNLADLRFPDGSRANDRVMSIEIVGRASVTLYENSRFNGAVFRATGDLRNLATYFPPESPNHWGNRISSLRVAGEGRGGRGRPVALSPVAAERAVKFAYRTVLDREVDAAGLRYYTRLVVDQGWTGAMVEDALRASDEYREVRVDRFVHLAYQDVLHRDADQSGLKHYRGLIIDHGWDVERIKSDLRRSREYREVVAMGR